MKKLVCLGAMCALMVLSGCGDNNPMEPSENNTSSTNNDAGDMGETTGCMQTCPAIGATQCMGDVIQGCAIGADGCIAWQDGLDCSTSGNVCDASGGIAMCVPVVVAPSCDDMVKNQDETDVDCGGSCPKCDNTKACTGNADCASDLCEGDVCVSMPGETCDDGIQNQDESDTDCGGSCPTKCAEMSACRSPSDCATNECIGDVCVPERTCTDGIQNQDESDIDCGGATSMCPRCMPDAMCVDGADCDSGFCVLGVCQAAGACDDGLQNQDETDVDCGGSCGACSNGKTCVASGDCRSNTCEGGGVNVCINPGGPTCSDGMQNRDESDVDCGGALCAPCMEDQACTTGADCASGACDLLTTQTCVSTTPRFSVDEDFETGDFSTFPYTFGGMGVMMRHDFTIEDTMANCHMGMHCMRSSRSHEPGETTFVEVSLSVRQDTNITFWVKTNLEPNEHYFRFYVDGMMEVERTGQGVWELITVPVKATGAGGPDRVLRWEYSRSMFISSDHAPWYEVWIDDIDMPDWNTEPSVPAQTRPTNGQLTTDTTPTFKWESFDPDFDTITYQMEYDTDPTFPLPVSTGETNDVQFTPSAPLANGRYYWRVRSKDDSNFRWSEWSETYALEIDDTYEYAAAWRQTARAQFDLNQNNGARILDEAVASGNLSYNQSGSVGIPHNGRTTTLILPMTPSVGQLTVNGTLTIVADGDFDSSSETLTVSVEGQSLGTFSATNCRITRTLNLSDIGRFANDGQVVVTVSTSSAVDRGGCSNRQETVRATLDYTVQQPGEMISVPIRFSTFEGKTLWEKIQVDGTGTITINVLDEQGMLIPDSALPGNSAGLTDRTIRLWDVDPMTYPVIRLKATLGPGAQMEEWRVIGNDHHEWLFSTDGDAEGWVGADRLGMPMVSVAGGVLRFTSTLDGTDPRIEYTMPQPVDSARFTAVEIRVKTSTEFFNDDVMFFWSSNFGGFDVRRSFTADDEFLVDFQDIVIDLTQTPMMPNETWRGSIEGLRVDPLDRFVDEFNMPADGFFEIDRIVLR